VADVPASGLPAEYDLAGRRESESNS
jgi:hypothetical protein